MKFCTIGLLPLLSDKVVLPFQLFYEDTFSPLLSYIPGALRGCQGQPSARPWPPLISSSGLQPPSSPIGSSQYEAVAYSLPYYPLPSTLYIIHAQLTCSLPYILVILPYIQTDPTPLRVVAGSKLRASPLSNFTILYFYLGRPRILQSSYTSRRLADRIHITVLEYGLGPLLYLGQLRTLQSRYTSRHQQITSAYGSRHGLGNKEDSNYLAKGQSYLDCIQLFSD